LRGIDQQRSNATAARRCIHHKANDLDALTARQNEFAFGMNPTANVVSRVLCYREILGRQRSKGCDSRRSCATPTGWPNSAASRAISSA
jgi:hypothetical protein